MHNLSNENTTKMIINSTDDENRVAIVSNNKIQEISVEQSSSEQLKGNIYRAKVVQIQDSIQAAFVDFGEKRHGFLALDEINYNIFPPQFRSDKEKFSIRSRLKTGQYVMVQVIREATETKGAAMSTFINLPGMYLVFTPNKDEGGVSKKINDDVERERLKSFIAGITSESNSVIIRTAGINRDLNDLKKDYIMLKKEWQSIKDIFENKEKPGLIYAEDNNIIKTIRDYYTDDIKEVWIDNPNPFQIVHAFYKKVIPAHLNRLKLYISEKPLFEFFGIENQIDELLDAKVQLPSGGSIVIEQTEALVSIDVNSGRSKQESSTNETALRTNLEAAEEVARQLRIRNLAGLIVIDFIDMNSDDNRRLVESKIAEMMQNEKASHNIGRISQFGLLELSRQRLSQGFAITQEEDCPHCKGRGKIPNIITFSNNVLRKIRSAASEGNIEILTITVPDDVAMTLLNKKRHELYHIEQEFEIYIELKISYDQSYSDPINIKVKKKRQERPQVKAPSQPKPNQSDAKYFEKSPQKEVDAVQVNESKRPSDDRATAPVAAPLAISSNLNKSSTKIQPQKVADNQPEIEKSEIVLSAGLFKNVLGYDTEAAMRSLREKISGKCPPDQEIFINEKYLLAIPSSVQLAAFSTNSGSSADSTADTLSENDGVSDTKDSHDLEEKVQSDDQKKSSQPAKPKRPAAKKPSQKVEVKADKQDESFLQKTNEKEETTTETEQTDSKEPISVAKKVSETAQKTAAKPARTTTKKATDSKKKVATASSNKVPETKLDNQKITAAVKSPAAKAKVKVESTSAKAPVAKKKAGSTAATKSESPKTAPAASKKPKAATGKKEVPSAPKKAATKKPDSTQK